MADEKKPSIFSKVLSYTDAMLDAQISKARTLAEPKYDEANFDFGKAVTRDRTMFSGSQGYQEKSSTLSFEYQKQIAIRSSIIAAIVKTFQNKTAAHAEYVPQGSKTGFKISLKHEQDKIDEIMEELFGEEDAPGKAPAENSKDAFNKAEGELPPDELLALDDVHTNDIPDAPLSEEEKRRAAKKELDKRTRAKKREIAEFLKNCGETENRPFESLKWNFHTFLKALVWDSLVYDQAAMELVPKEAERLNGRLNLHHIVPVDGSTVRYASPELAKYRNGHMAMAADILYPEEELKSLEATDALKLDDDRLERNEYKYVQVVRGRIERAFTADELKVGMRNPITDIYANGYSISELELLTSLVTSHLQTENFNKLFFQQGFSAKGILHVKANLNRSKLEELRRNWSAMVKGNRQSFQTPIMAGMDAIEWIPLTQSHSDMEFNSWLQYLIRLICALYQIDPSEINCGIKDMGGSGGISGDNTKEKLSNSRDKGFVPLMKWAATFINTGIIDNLDPDYQLEWVGLEDTADAMAKASLAKEESQWVKTVNEVRAEQGLPPIKGADFLQNPVFFQFWSTMSEAGQAFMKAQSDQAMAMSGGMPPGGAPGEEVPVGGDNLEGDQKTEANPAKKVKASEDKHANEVVKKARALKVEYFRLDDE